jgi:TonB family protein
MHSLIRRISLFVFVGVAPVIAGAAESETTNHGYSPWKIHQTAQAQFPPRLSYNGVTHGQACVRVSIDQHGTLLDALVVSCSHLDFGAEALRTVRRWSYEPEWNEGQPIGIVSDIVFDFQMNGPVAFEKRSPAPNEGKYAPRDPHLVDDPNVYQAESLKHIDRIPELVRAVAPVYPQDWSARDISGSATVDFYIDETGRARVPVVTSADHHLLGASAAAAVAQWQFEPPTLHGKPVLVHAVQTFTFQPDPKTAAHP